MKGKNIYIFKNKEIPRIKIGISNDVEGRFANIRRMSGCKLEIVWVSEELTNAAYIERKIHDYLHKDRHIGEWFNIDAEEALIYVKETIESDGVLYIPRIRVFDETAKYQPVSLPRFVPNNKKEENTKALDINDYKRVEAGVYADKNGQLYSIKYKKDGGWSVEELEIIK